MTCFAANCSIKLWSCLSNIISLLTAQQKLLQNKIVQYYSQNVLWYKLSLFCRVLFPLVDWAMRYGFFWPQVQIVFLGNHWIERVLLYLELTGYQYWKCIHAKSIVCVCNTPTKWMWHSQTIQIYEFFSGTNCLKSNARCCYL